MGYWGRMLIMRRNQNGRIWNEIPHLLFRGNGIYTELRNRITKSLMKNFPMVPPVIYYIVRPNACQNNNDSSFDFSIFSNVSIFTKFTFFWSISSLKNNSIFSMNKCFVCMRTVHPYLGSDHSLVYMLPEYLKSGITENFRYS